MAHAIATANENNPYDVAWSGYFAAALQLRLREYLQAEALAERAVELSEKINFRRWRHIRDVSSVKRERN